MGSYINISLDTLLSFRVGIAKLNSFKKTKKNRAKDPSRDFSFYSVSEPFRTSISSARRRLGSNEERSVMGQVAALLRGRDGMQRFLYYLQSRLASK
jgi:hypothetical protein